MQLTRDLFAIAKFLLFTSLRRQPVCYLFWFPVFAEMFVTVATFQKNGCSNRRKTLRIDGQ